MHKSAASPLIGCLHVGNSRFRCALGRSGIGSLKREGDGKTPRGCWPLRRVFFRADKVIRPLTSRPLHVIKSGDAWCDDLDDRRYNRLIRKAPSSAEECLTRKDHLYDIIVELGFNDAPVKRGAGSAIFWHAARPGFSPTAGCVAIRLGDFAKILPRLSRHAVMRIF